MRRPEAPGRAGRLGQQIGREPAPEKGWLGRSAWKLPRRMERAMPDVDIEGEHLLETLHPARP